MCIWSNAHVLKLEENAKSMVLDTNTATLQLVVVLHALNLIYLLFLLRRRLLLLIYY